MAESKPTLKGTAKWSARFADHITRSDWHDRHADQRYPREDDATQCYPRGDDVIQRYLKGDDARRWVTMV